MKVGEKEKSDDSLCTFLSLSQAVLHLISREGRNSYMVAVRPRRRVHDSGLRR